MVSHPVTDEDSDSEGRGRTQASLQVRHRGAGAGVRDCPILPARVHTCCLRPKGTGKAPGRRT